MRELVAASTRPAAQKATAFQFYDEAIELLDASTTTVLTLEHFGVGGVTPGWWRIRIEDPGFFGFLVRNPEEIKDWLKGLAKFQEFTLSSEVTAKWLN